MFSYALTGSRKKLGIRLLSPNHVTLYKEGSGAGQVRVPKIFYCLSTFFDECLLGCCRTQGFQRSYKVIFSQLLIFCCCCFHGEGPGASQITILLTSIAKLLVKNYYQTNTKLSENNKERKERKISDLFQEAIF